MRPREYDDSLVSVVGINLRVTQPRSGCRLRVKDANGILSRRGVESDMRWGTITDSRHCEPPESQLLRDLKAGWRKRCVNFHVSIREETLELTSGTQKQLDWHHKDVRGEACIACHRLHTQEACTLSLPTPAAAELGASLPIWCDIPMPNCTHLDVRVSLEGEISVGTGESSTYVYGFELVETRMMMMMGGRETFAVVCADRALPVPPGGRVRAPSPRRRPTEMRALFSNPNTPPSFFALRFLSILTSMTGHGILRKPITMC